MNKVLIVINVRVKNNPALIFFINELRNEYQIRISGGDNLKNNDLGVPYNCHSSWYQRFIYLKLHWVLKFIFVVLYRNNELYNQILIKLRLYLSKVQIQIQNYKPDVIIAIDSEAGFIIRGCDNKIKKFFYIYDFYADQFLNISEKHKIFLEKIEKKAVLSSDILISCINSEIGNYINNKYQTNKELLILTITPKATFQESTIKISDPIRIYYHGVIIENRGLESLILATKKFEGIQVFIRGFGTILNELKELVISQNLTNKVFFLEPVDTQLLSEVGKEYDFGATMGRMNVANHLYATGFKTFENLSAGLALILPKSYPLKKLNQEYKVGITYSDATVEELERVFEYIIHHKEEIMIWKKNVRSAYHQEYNPARQKEKLIQKINQLIHA